MTSWQERVLNEKAELDSKICKLSDFLFSGSCQEVLAAQDILDLEQQLVHMVKYSSVLRRRIKRFNLDEGQEQ
jgi:hypothetical protein